MSAPHESVAAEFGRMEIDPLNLELLAGSTDMSAKSCLERLRTARLMELGNAWRDAAPGSAEAKGAFYGHTDLYVPEPMAWNSDWQYSCYLARLHSLSRLWPTKQQGKPWTTDRAVVRSRSPLLSEAAP